MKKSIVTFIIGLLIGAIIATGGFYAYTKLSSNNNAISSSMQGQPPEMPGGDNSNQPPEKPDGGDSNQPPQMPNDSNNSQSADQNLITDSNS